MHTNIHAHVRIHTHIHTHVHKRIHIYKRTGDNRAWAHGLPTPAGSVNESHILCNSEYETTCEREREEVSIDTITKSSQSPLIFPPGWIVERPLVRPPFSPRPPLQSPLSGLTKRSARGISAGLHVVSARSTSISTRPNIVSGTVWDGIVSHVLPARDEGVSGVSADIQRGTTGVASPKQLTRGGGADGNNVPCAGAAEIDAAGAQGTSDVIWSGEDQTQQSYDRLARQCLPRSHSSLAKGRSSPWCMCQTFVFHAVIVCCSERGQRFGQTGTLSWKLTATLHTETYQATQLSLMSIRLPLPLCPTTTGTTSRRPFSTIPGPRDVKQAENKCWRQLDGPGCVLGEKLDVRVASPSARTVSLHTHTTARPLVGNNRIRISMKGRAASDRQCELQHLNQRQPTSQQTSARQFESLVRSNSSNKVTTIQLSLTMSPHISNIRSTYTTLPLGASAHVLQVSDLYLLHKVPSIPLNPSVIYQVLTWKYSKQTGWAREHNWGSRVRADFGKPGVVPQSLASTQFLDVRTVPGSAHEKSDEVTCDSISQVADNAAYHDRAAWCSSTEHALHNTYNAHANQTPMQDHNFMRTLESPRQRRGSPLLHQGADRKSERGIRGMQKGLGRQVTSGSMSSESVRVKGAAQRIERSELFDGELRPWTDDP